MFLKNILELLRSDEWNRQSDVIDIAKGKHKTPESVKEVINYIKRRRGGRKG